MSISFYVSPCLIELLDIPQKLKTSDQSEPNFWRLKTFNKFGFVNTVSAVFGAVVVFKTAYNFLKKVLSNTAMLIVY